MLHEEEKKYTSKVYYMILFSFSFLFFAEMQLKQPDVYRSHLLWFCSKPSCEYSSYPPSVLVITLNHISESLMCWSDPRKNCTNFTLKAWKCDHVGLKLEHLQKKLAAFISLMCMKICVNGIVAQYIHACKGRANAKTSCSLYPQRKATGNGRKNKPTNAGSHMCSNNNNNNYITRSEILTFHFITLIIQRIKRWLHQI